MVVGVGVGLPLAAAAVLGGQIYHAANGERPDLEPSYEIAARVGDASGHALRLVVLGDSTAAGVGSATLEGSLPVLVADRVAKALDRPVEVVGHGVSGARTADTRAEQVPLLAGVEPDVTVISVGSNDVTHVTPPWTLQRQTRELLDAARAEADGAPVVLAGIPLFAGTPRLPQPLRAVVMGYARPLRAAQREAVGTRGVAYVDIARDASPRFKGVPDAMSADGYHPSPIGYGFWADAIAVEVVAALRGQPKP